MRLQFVERLQKILGEDLAWGGHGVAATETKWEGIAPFRFHLSLENQSRPFVITEKLLDPMLAYSVPIYWGAPNAYRFVSKSSFVQLRNLRVGELMRVLRAAEQASALSGLFQAVTRERRVVLNEINFVERLGRIVHQVVSEAPSRRRIPTHLRSRSSSS